MLVQHFTEFKLKSSTLDALNDQKITVPTKTQKLTIPYLLENKNDIVALAKTGTGKTLAFIIPLLQLIDIKYTENQCIIVAPTRELGQQILKNIDFFLQHDSQIKSIGLFGGQPVKLQVETLVNNFHIIVATPGRLVDLISKNALSINNCRFLILDEADEIATAHAENLDTILKAVPKEVRKWLFSATMTSHIKQLVNNFLHKNAITIQTDMETIGNQKIDHQYVVVDAAEKLDVLMHFLNSREGASGIIFCKTKAAVNKLGKNLAINKFKVGALHGSLTQPIRDRIMDQFRAGHIDLLVATDLASRGLDIPEVSFVVNYHFPDVPDTYVHRTGRTARASASGFALTILQPDEVPEISIFEKALGLKFSVFEKPKPQNLVDNNALIWAKKIFKTKPNHDIDIELKTKVKTIFYHLTKDELIEKLLSNFFFQNK